MFWVAFILIARAIKGNKRLCMGYLRTFIFLLDFLFMGLWALLSVLLSVLSRDPQNIGLPVIVGNAGGDEKPVRQAVYVLQSVGVYRLVLC